MTAHRIQPTIARALLPVVEQAVAEARAEALRNPYDKDGYCEFCGNGSWKPHTPECAWADLRDAQAEAWDEGWGAARRVVDLDGRKVWAHTVMPDGFEDNPYREATP